MEKHAEPDRGTSHNRLYKNSNGMPAEEETEKRPAYIDIMLREWRWLLAVLLAGGFLVLPASKTEVQEVKAAVASNKDTVAKLGDVINSLTRTIGLLEESRNDVLYRVNRLETKMDEDRQILIRIEEKMSPVYVPPISIVPALPGKSNSKSKNLH